MRLPACEGAPYKNSKAEALLFKQKWNIMSLRYFNPAGAHPSGRIGECPTKTFTNIMHYIAQVALGHKPHVTIFGNDYDTVDGTGKLNNNFFSKIF